MVRRIPRGRVATYGQIAGLVPGCSGARQVGYALHALPEGSLVPWHRVINAQGVISLRGSGAITQQIRLDRDGVVVLAGGRIDLGRYRWRPKGPASRNRVPRPGGR